MIRISMVPSLCLVLAACADNAAESPRDAATEDAAALTQLAPASCERDSDCDGRDAECRPDGHVCTERCSSITIDSPESLADARRCREIEGNLLIQDSDLVEIDGDDLPYLERITGSLVSAGSKPMRILTLPALHTVGTRGEDNILEVILDSRNLVSVSFPALRTVYGGIGMFGLYALRDLDLSALTEVEGSMALMTLPSLARLQLHPELTVEKTFELQYLCGLPASELHVPSATKRNAIGCCTESSLECEPMSLCDCADGPDGDEEE